MTNEQILKICSMAIAACNAVPYGVPALTEDNWVIGFRKPRDEMALQVEFPDREIRTDAEEYAAAIELERRIRSAFMMSA